MNALLAAQRALDGNPAGWRYYALVSDAGGFMRGCAAGVPAYIASGPTGSGSYGWDGDGSYGDWYGGHELGHTYGRAHAEFCGAGWGAAYPYPDGAIGGPASEPDRYYGWDIETLQVYTPYWKDVMTYCPFEWISNFTYEGIRSRLLGESSWSLRESEPAADEYLAVVGSVNLDTHEAALGTLYRLRDLPAQEPPTPSEDWAIALLNQAGGVLARYPFTPKENSEAETPGKGPAQIIEMIPWNAATARVSVQFRGQEVAGRAVSAHAPSVQMLYPNGGETLDPETVLASWQGSDADQDALTYALQYSADGGQSWKTLASELLVTQWTISTGALPGSNQALFRVIASDGVNTAQDQSDRPFRVPGKPPQALIISPQAQMALTAEQQLNLVGEAYDLEDGLLPDQALGWSSNLQGVLGVGAQLAVNLTPGVHTITLSAQDSDGQSGVSAVQVTVTARGEWPPAVELPLLLKSR